MFKCTAILFRLFDNHAHFLEWRQVVIAKFMQEINNNYVKLLHNDGKQGLIMEIRCKLHWILSILLLKGE